MSARIRDKPLERTPPTSHKGASSKSVPVSHSMTCWQLQYHVSEINLFKNVSRVTNRRFWLSRCLCLLHIYPLTQPFRIFSAHKSYELLTGVTVAHDRSQCPPSVVCPKTNCCVKCSKDSHVIAMIHPDYLTDAIDWHSVPNSLYQTMHSIKTFLIRNLDLSVSCASRWEAVDPPSNEAATFPIRPLHLWIPSVANSNQLEQCVQGNGYLRHSSNGVWSIRPLCSFRRTYVVFWWPLFVMVVILPQPRRSRPNSIVLNRSVHFLIVTTTPPETSTLFSQRTYVSAFLHSIRQHIFVVLLHPPKKYQKRRKPV